ncbi:MAG: PD-(D/E)XK nuclease-like domain-containing protein [Microbacterium gubbeenense]|uniref:PD-(D/E)XK nuclease-like domain-containing protein n=1 Tax=Microbacterium gubbeenense TaxID=159896 RepID=UPI003F9B5E6D
MIDFNMDENEYHAHKSLSASGAKLLLDSPAKYKYEVIDKNRSEKKSFDIGSAVHAKVLGVGSGIEVLEFDSFRTKAAQVAQKEARASGLIPMLAKDMKPIDDMAEAVLNNVTARALLQQDGHPEVSVFSTDPELGIEMRCRFDFLPDHRNYGVDLKTVGKSASPQGFAKQVAEFGYDVQEAHYGYVYGLHAESEPISMAFIAVETKPPYLVGVYQLPESFRDAGRKAAARARAKYAHGITTGEWPGYPTGLTELVQPVWHQYKAIDDDNEEDF